MIDEKRLAEIGDRIERVAREAFEEAAEAKWRDEVVAAREARDRADAEMLRLRAWLLEIETRASTSGTRLARKALDGAPYADTKCPRCGAMIPAGDDACRSGDARCPK